MSALKAGELEAEFSSDAAIFMELFLYLFSINSSCGCYKLYCQGQAFYRCCLKPNTTHFLGYCDIRLNNDLCVVLLYPKALRI